MVSKPRTVKFHMCRYYYEHCARSLEDTLPLNVYTKDNYFQIKKRKFLIYLYICVVELDIPMGERNCLSYGNYHCLFLL